MNTTTKSIVRRATIFSVGVVLGLSSLSGVASAAPDESPKSESHESTSTGNDGQNSSTKDCDGSHHSDTGNGANTDGPDNNYHNTCDGRDSGNGLGGGSAKGRPCAGCVGNADDKNPPGQYPDGSDHNNGYECDGNSGIARENPAHTGCAPESGDINPTVDTPPATCPNGHEMTDDGNGGKTCSKPAKATPARPAVKPAVASPALAPAAAVLGASESASAVVQPASPGRPSQVLGVQYERPAPVELSAALARTGSNTLVLADLGITMVLLGLAALAVQKRSSRLSLTN